MMISLSADEERKNGQDDDHEADEVDDAVSCLKKLGANFDESQS